MLWFSYNRDATAPKAGHLRLRYRMAHATTQYIGKTIRAMRKFLYCIL